MLARSPRIYLDHAATTTVDPAVVAAMAPYWTATFGNASSLYEEGRQARAALRQARAEVAATLACADNEVIFTSGGTEGNNFAVRGVVDAARLAGRGHHLITTPIEHHAVLHTAEYLRRFGAQITLLDVDAAGVVDPAALEAAIRPETCLVSIGFANNEIGTIQDLAALTAVTRRHGVPFHTDAVQAIGSLPVNVDELGVDLLTLAAHKFYGPKGAGALYVRRGTPILPQLHGGPQENDRRAGTENVALAVGLATALARARDGRIGYTIHCAALRDRLRDGILETIPDTRLNGPSGDRRLPNNLNVAFRGVDGEGLIIALDLAGISASSGSACTTGATEPSHVLRAIGVPPDSIQGSLRLTVGRHTTDREVDHVLELLPTVVARLREEHQLDGPE